MVVVHDCRDVARDAGGPQAPIGAMRDVGAEQTGRAWQRLSAAALDQRVKDRQSDAYAICVLRALAFRA